MQETPDQPQPNGLHPALQALITDKTVSIEMIISVIEQMIVSHIRQQRGTIQQALIQSHLRLCESNFWLTQAQAALQASLQPTIELPPPVIIH